MAVGRRSLFNFEGSGRHEQHVGTHLDVGMRWHWLAFAMFLEDRSLHWRRWCRLHPCRIRLAVACPGPWILFADTTTLAHNSNQLEKISYAANLNLKDGRVRVAL